MARLRGDMRDMRDVELVDAGPDHDHPPGPRADGRAPRGTPPAWASDLPGGRRTRAGRRGAAVLAVVAAVALAGGVAADRRESRRESELAAVPGVVRSLERPVAELWGTADRPVDDLHLVGDRLVGAVAREGGGGVDVVALALATGEDVWRTAVGTGRADARWTSCVVPGRHRPGPGAGTDDATDDSTDDGGGDGGSTPGTPVVVCVVVDETTTTEASALGTRTYPTRARLVVVDAVSGDIRRDEPTLPTGVLATVDDDVLLAEVAPEGRPHVVRLDPRSGHRRWSRTGPDALPADEFRQRTVRIEAAGDLVAVDGGSVRVLRASDGSLVDSWRRDASLDTGGQVQVLGGGTLLARPAATSDGGWGTRVVELASGREAGAPGYPLPVRPDDGSLAGSVVMLSVEGLDLLVLDVASGRVRWSVPAGSGGLPVVMDGRVVRAERRSLLARDGRTGEVLWSAALPARTGSPLMTDGRSVLVSLPDGRGGGELVAFGLSDGRRTWSVGLPQEVVLTSADGQLLGSSSGRLVALGAPDRPRGGVTAVVTD
ncbi:outer membrane protein assembly factor BamB family protein [Cellulomonas aerilata]|uniref:Pyrrolo-quinoline quinone repeat domain-containing protein n=1 Tax=Cellulomonas aerilata TaxID=515326 RepID=A0A512DFM6_9CELL|nr:PQQ-binding-like beta-propeller repeat protein [Cellulomonas aerilata]GEO35294.1 hypothetical protein CAE01nite_30190 [Cellulomonas aerilata]